jgi:hypothetical protein
MGDLGESLVFFLGGAIFANFVPAAKFLILAPVVTLIYYIYTVAKSGHFGAPVAAAIAAFACIQLGYVGGLALVAVYGRFSRKNDFRPRFSEMREKETKID